jgi:Right handed beta helix region
MFRVLLKVKRGIMKGFRRPDRYLLAAVSVILSCSCVQAANVKVHCGGKGQFTSISSALKTLDPNQPNTITVKGKCHENVLIQSFDRLTLISTSGSTINDASGGLGVVVDIEDSHVNLQEFTINGGDNGVVCGSASICYLTSNTVQSVVGQEGVVLFASHAFLANNVIQNNADRGMTVKDGAVALSSNDIFRGNMGITTAGGIAVISGAHFAASNSTVQNNGGMAGILATSHSSLRLISCTITGNAGDGVALKGGSDARFEPFLGPITVTGNGGSGVSLADLWRLPGHAKTKTSVSTVGGCEWLD